MSLPWTIQTVPGAPSGFSFKQVVWCHGLAEYWAVGSGPGVGTTTNLLYKSADGVTWVNVDPGFQKNHLAIAWSEDLQVICTLSALSFTGGTSTHVITRSDDGGATWTEHDIPDGSGATAANNSQFRGICWAAGTIQKFIAVAQVTANAHQVMTSADGITWANQVAAAARSWTSVEWASSLGLLIATAGSNSVNDNVMTSTDGVSWTSRTTPVNVRFTNNNGLRFANGIMVAFGDVNNGATSADRDHLFTSTNGTTWVQTVDAGMLAIPGWTKAAWNGSLWIAVNQSTAGPDFPVYATSPDTVTWTLYPDPLNLLSGTWTDIIYSPDLVQVVALESGSARLMTAEVQGLAPTSSRDRGDVTVTIKTNGVNGGFTNQAGAQFAVVFYPFAALGLSAPDFLTNYFLGGGYVFGLLASNVTWVDAFTLTCTPPHGCGDGSQYGLAPGPISVDVAVFDISKIVTPNCQFFLPGGFTYVDPVMLSVSPTHGTVLGGEVITITGSNFYPDEGEFLLGTNIVRFGQVNALCTYVSPTQLTCVAPSFYGDVNTDPVVDLLFLPSRLSASTGLNPLGSFGPASTTLVDAYTYTAVWWIFDPTLGFDFSFFDLTWEDLDFGFGIGALGSEQFSWYYFALSSPGRGWTVFGSGSTPPDPNGWWMSIEGFTGSVLIVANSRPKNPRTWTDFVAFATGTAAMLGGSPGYGCVLNNKLVYAATGYTVGTTFPPIRIFDGTFDRELCTLPPTTAGAVPKAIVSMLAANGTIYLSTLDTGSDSTNWVGRVFSLDIETATLTPVGAAFTTGHVPYALAWHNGRLYCGTQRQVSTAVGKIYSILPAIDTAWVEDYDLATSSMAGVASMLSFQGTLFVGCTAAAGTFAAVIKRATDGTYSTAVTGSGGTAKANNAFLSLAEFDGQIYAAYWNNDTTAITSIRKSSDGTTWSVSFTGATSTLRPIIALFVDDGILYAIGGGLSLSAAILSTVDGITWTNLTAQLPDTGETALPVFGVVVF